MFAGGESREEGPGGREGVVWHVGGVSGEETEATESASRGRRGRGRGVGAWDARLEGGAGAVNRLAEVTSGRLGAASQPGGEATR